jgi:hypothetical protein
MTIPVRFCSPYFYEEISSSSSKKGLKLFANPPLDFRIQGEQIPVSRLMLDLIIKTMAARTI